MLLACGGAHAGTWSDLWLTRDQQAQRLLDADRPAEAARLFQDTRHQGYAELRAGDYSQAAKLLEGHADADSQYNRGNALAHAGRLKEALAAYDAALAGAPGDRDVIHNRKLVEQALKDESSSGKSRKDSRGNHNSSESGTKTDSPSHAGNGAQTQRDQKAKSESAHQPSSGGASNEATTAGDEAEPQSAQTNRGGGAAQGGNKPPHPVDAGNSSAFSADQGNSSSKSGNPASARAPTESSAGQKKSAQAANAPGRSEKSADRAPDSAEHAYAVPEPPRQQSKPPSEQSLAMDQWLRTIPDDSGELLQRKFLIEHLMKQRGSEP